MGRLWFSVAAMAIGMMAGVCYFGGLWLTVKNLTHIKRPVLFSIGSYFLRLGISGGCFYLVIKTAQWRAILSCLTGFIVVHIFLRWKLGARKAPSSLHSKGGSL